MRAASWLLLLMLGTEPWLRAQPAEIRLASTAILLASPKAADRALAVRNEVLLRCDRLMPAETAAESVAVLAEYLAELGPSPAGKLKALLETFPRDDELTFDGKGYGGDNFGFIDAIIGLHGRPIAMDREPPAFLVPLRAKAEAAYEKQRETFQGAAENKTQIAAAATREIGASLMGNGTLLRAYRGRFDDLYFHLFENGNGLSGIAFWALADELGKQRYSPGTGTVDAALAPETRFDLSNVFSGGGRAALRAWQSTQGQEARPALEGFAYRIVPMLAGRLAAAKPGASVIASSEDFARARSSPRVMYPTGVPPLFRSPDRFYGARSSRLIFVANEQRIILSDADTLYPMPAQGATAQPEFPGADDARSTALFSSTSAAGLTWEDPAESKLLADPAKDGAPESGDPRLRPPVRRMLAVVIATASESEEYAKEIAASDDQIRGQEKLRRRAVWLSANLQTLAGDSEALSAAVKSDGRQLQQAQEQASAEMLRLLRARFEVRAALEATMRRDRWTPLQASLEKPVGSRD